MIENVPPLALRALPIISKLGSVTGAAAELGVSQPAVSRAVATLEKILGVTALRRGSGMITLTAEGERLAELSTRAATLYADALRDVSDLKRKKTGTIRIGSFGASASARLLPELIVRFSTLHPAVSVEVREISDGEMPAALRDGTVDFALLVAPEDDEFEIIHLAEDRLVALIPETEKVKCPTSVTASEIENTPFIMTKGGSEPLVRRWFSRAHIEPNIRHEVLQLTSILAFVRAGLGVSIIAELAVPDTHPHVTILPLDPPAPRCIALARRRGTPRAEATRAFWRLIERR
jgi:DNA-binding transcriptional LysR family regulator